MNLNHQICLSLDVWTEFVYSLNHCDQDRRDKTGAFFSEIEQNIVIRHEPRQIIIETPKLDEDAILSALLDTRQSDYDSHLVETFGIKAESLFDIDGMLPSIYQADSRDSYYHLLTARKNPATAYSSEQVNPFGATAA